MQNKRYIICGNADFTIPGDSQEKPLYYHLVGKDDELRKVTLRIGDFRESLYKEIPSRFHDLLEIATYVYCADQEVIRGQYDVETFGSNWRRHFHFVIPVRDVDFWTSQEIYSLLAGLLGFLSDDKYEFTFVELVDNVSFQRFLNFNDDGSMFGNPEQIVMFSGGLDSLGGAVEEIINQKRRVILVNHRSTPKLDKRYRDLAEKLNRKASDSCKPTHVRVTIKKRKEMNKEYTQRSRSFLFVSIGAAIAQMLNLDSVRFYENGVISLNLPICEQVTGGRATRTTHPRVIHGFKKLLSKVAGKEFTIENPFIDKTKGEIVKLIADAGCQHMIGSSISCTHTWEMTKDHSHCGTCSQCIDRRFAVAAAGMIDHDPLSHYAVDIFTEAREKDVHVADDKTMYAGYLERANQAKNIADCAEFAAKYPEVLRAVKFLPGDVGQATDRVFDMYKRHAAEVNRVIDEMGAKHFSAIRERTLPANCLIRIVHESCLPTSVSAVPVAAEPLPDNVYRWKGGAWQVRYAGQKYFGQEDFIVQTHLGASYIHRLLSSPHKAISAVEIACSTAVDLYEIAISEKQAEAEGLSVSANPLFSSLGNISDMPAVKQYRAKVSELKADIEKARAEGDKLVEQECYEEMVVIERQIREAVGIGGRLKQANNKRKNIRDRFRNNVNRVIDKIKDTDPDLAAHLTKSISFGDTPKYAPETDISWDITPTTHK